MKYEYKILHAVGNIDASTVRKLNVLGSDGWEVVAHQVYDWGLGDDAYCHAFTLKRETT